MGVNFPYDDEAIEELRRLSGTARAYLEHHLGNSLSAVLLASENGRRRDVRLAVEHMREDLQAFGCFGAAPGSGRTGELRAGKRRKIRTVFSKEGSKS